MEGLLAEYLPILIFLGIAIAMAVLMVAASYIVARQRPDSEKDSAYECGFEAFDDARGRFDVRFYLVAILFIIFDLEVAFLFPWAVALTEIGVFGFWSMVIFLGILTIGFIYEWKKGGLEWEYLLRTPGRPPDKIPCSGASATNSPTRDLLSHNSISLRPGLKPDRCGR